MLHAQALFRSPWMGLRRLGTSCTLYRPVLPPQGFSLAGKGPLKVRSCAELQSRTIPEYTGSPHSKLRNVIWRNALQNIYVVKKPWNEGVKAAMVLFINFVHSEYPSLNVIVSEDVGLELQDVFQQAAENSGEKQTSSLVLGPKTVYTGSVAEIVAKTDLIVSLGGDGTTLRAVSAFLNGLVPPVLCFALGTLGFLLPFDFSTFRETFLAVFESRSKAIHRMRLECHVVRQDKEEIQSDSRQVEKEQIMEYELAHYKQHHDATMLYAMNDISLHRGLAPSLIKLDIYIDSEFFTTTSADGLIFASPTGSTAYSLSSGGSVVHPLVPCILLTPICPQSLSFRPLVLPATLHVMIKLSSDNRNELVKMTIDGIPQHDLKPGDEIHVVSENGTIYIPGNHQPPKTLRSRNTFDDYIEPGNLGSGKSVPNGIFCIAKGENDWTIGINELLGFNSSFRGKNRDH